MKVVIAGGGPIGLAVAWRAPELAHRVTVVDPDPARAAGLVAAGRLAPICELQYGEEAVTQLGLRSNQMWPTFVQDLEEASGSDLAYEANGMLMVARDRDDLAVLDRLASHQEQLSLEVERLNARQMRRLEPALAPSIRGGLHVMSDHAVDPRRLVGALDKAATSLGVERVAGRVVSAGATSVELDTGASEAADAVVLAGGGLDARRGHRRAGGSAADPTGQGSDLAAPGRRAGDSAAACDRWAQRLSGRASPTARSSWVHRRRTSASTGR